MKAINIYLDETEHKEFINKKGKLTWKMLLLLSLKKVTEAGKHGNQNKSRISRK
mgnify:CR=1 FL=1